MRLVSRSAKWVSASSRLGNGAHSCWRLGPRHGRHVEQTALADLVQVQPAIASKLRARALAVPTEACGDHVDVEAVRDARVRGSWRVMQRAAPGSEFAIRRHLLRVSNSPPGTMIMGASGPNSADTARAFNLGAAQAEGKCRRTTSLPHRRANKDCCLKFPVCWSARPWG
jgi:hypothetical protein